MKSYLERKKKKGQSAIEYLMTYGWMLLVVAIVGGAIFSTVGSQSIESTTGFDSNNIDIRDFGVTQESGLVFSTEDPLKQTTVKEVTVSNPDTANITYKLNHNPSQEELVNLPGIKTSEDSNELQIDIVYDTNSLEDLMTSGTVVGDIQIDENFEGREMIMDGLINYQPLDEKYSQDNTLFDLALNSNHGSKVNDPQFVDGIIGAQALEFDGADNYVNLGSDIVFEDSEDYTISFWWESYEETPDGNWQKAVGRRGGWSETIMIRDDDLRLSVYDTDSNHFTAETLGTENFGEVFHSVLVSSDGEWKWYIDNEKVSSTTEHPTDININRLSQSGSDRAWNGRLDEVHVYDRALREDEIQTIYQQGDP